jgi:hypothetical protein
VGVTTFATSLLAACGSARISTIFEDSPIPLDKWLATIWMIANAKNGVSSYEIHRSIGVTQKTAWFMLHRIRLAMQSESFERMDGEVEVDETFIGGKARFMHKARRERIKGKARRASVIGKTAVMGLLERHGPDGHSRVRAKVILNTSRRVFSSVVRRNVEAGADVFTDARPSYLLLRINIPTKSLTTLKAMLGGGFTPTDWRTSGAC